MGLDFCAMHKDRRRTKNAEVVLRQFRSTTNGTAMDRVDTQTDDIRPGGCFCSTFLSRYRSIGRIF